MSQHNLANFLRLVVFLIIVGLCFTLAVALLTSCTHPEVNKCTYICPTNDPPVGCYCLEDESETKRP